MPINVGIAFVTGRNLSFGDIQHYQKIIVALTETDRLMKEIDKVDLIS